MLEYTQKPLQGINKKAFYRNVPKHTFHKNIAAKLL